MISYEESRRELKTPQGVLRYHEAGSGPPLVLLHGSGPGVTGWRNFRGNIGVFAEHFHTLVFEFPGFGVSDETEEHPLVGAAGSVIRFLDALGVESASIVGNSMGGMVGSRVARQAPSRVERLVTIGGVGVGLFNPAPGEGIRLLTAFTQDPTRPRLVQWLQSMVYDQSILTEELIEERWELASSPDVLACLRKIFAPASLVAALRDPVKGAGGPEWAQLHTITQPTLLTWGRDDRVTPLDAALIPMRTMPNAELHVFPNCGHWVMIEAKQAWESAVLAFLTRRSPVAGNPGLVYAAQSSPSN